MYLAGGTMHLFKPASEIPELQEGRLLQLVERCVSRYVLRQTANAHVHMLCLSVLLSRFWTPCQKAPSICCLTCGGRDTNCMHEQNLIMGLACYRWLREEKRERKLAARKQTSDKDTNKIDLAQWSNGWAPGRMTASIRDSSNTVMRM